MNTDGGLPLRREPQNGGAELNFGCKPEISARGLVLRATLSACAGVYIFWADLGFEKPSQKQDARATQLSLFVPGASSATGTGEYSK